MTEFLFLIPCLWHLTRNHTLCKTIINIETLSYLIHWQSQFFTIFYCQRDSFVFGFFPSSPKSVHIFRQGGRNSRCSDRSQYQQIIYWHSARKEKTNRVLFLKHGWDTSLDSKSENKYRSDLYFGDSRACLFLSAIKPAQAAILCLSSHGKILAESFQFDWKENIFYKLEKYIQPDCMMINLPSQTELSKCNDYVRSAHPRNWNLRTRLAELWRKLPSAFSKTKTWI